MAKKYMTGAIYTVSACVLLKASFEHGYSAGVLDTKYKELVRQAEYEKLLEQAKFGEVTGQEFECRESLGEESSNNDST